MKKHLLFAAVIIIFICLLLTMNCFAEDKPIKFTPTQQKTLEAMVMGTQVAQNRIKEFVDYLVAEYKVDQSYTISKDMSGFEKIPQPKEEEVKK